ncbi:MAG: spore coat protein [Firmicutes bacterium HGW-Firmicutes-12]|nr:MAG: spore coat protein [Firmicutes bacterium HGW-Firmicutes-12]
MKGVILAGGRGTRLSPLTKITNKHLLPVGKEPMVFNPVKQLISAGITDIIVVTAKEYAGEFRRLLGSGKELGCDFTFRVQDEPRGIAHALLLCEDFTKGENITVILGDNIAANSIKPYVRVFERQGGGAKVLLKKVADPSRYGIASIDEQSIISIEEKPLNSLNQFAVIGMYFYDSQVYDIIRSIGLSSRGELEITPVNNEYIARGKLTYDVLEGEWIDAGTYEAYREANDILFSINNEIRR